MKLTYVEKWLLRLALAIVALLVVSQTMAATPLVKGPQSCTNAELNKATAIGAGVGLTVGVILGGVVAATGTVAAPGAPMALTYFTGTGSAAFGSWMTLNVLPTMTIAGVYMGFIGALINRGVLSEQCAEYLKTNPQAILKRS